MEMTKPPPPVDPKAKAAAPTANEKRVKAPKVKMESAPKSFIGFPKKEMESVPKSFIGSPKKSASPDGYDLDITETKTAATAKADAKKAEAAAKKAALEEQKLARMEVSKKAAECREGRNNEGCC